MWRTTIAGLRAHARRLVGTVAAVVLGVAFVAGTLVFDATVSVGFFDAFARGAAHVDASVQPAAAGHKSNPMLAPSTPATVGELPEVGSVAGRMQASLPLLGDDGRPVTNFGQVGIGVSTDGPADLLPFTVAGRVPRGDGEALLDTATAGHLRLHTGQSITVADRTGARHVLTLVGLMDFGVSKTYADQTVVGLPAGRLTAFTGTAGYAEVVATARPGVSPARLVASIGAALGPGARVVTGDQRRLDLANSATSVATQFTSVLLIFGVIALLVSTFVIYNTFAVLLAQRIRETALLRCVGATRRQVFAATVTESAVVGAAGSVLGVLAGIGVAAVLFAVVGRLPHHGIVVEPDAVGIGLLVGTGVTVASALLPALRATRTSPLAALRDVGVPAVASRARTAVRVAVAAAVVGAGAMVTWLSTGLPDSRTGAYGIVAGGTVTFLGLLIVLPVVIGPLCGALGRLLAALAGSPARLAAANTRRNPGRTAVTTGTLMIGIGLMALFAVIFASIDRTAHDELAGHYPVDYIVFGVQYGEGTDHADIAPAFAAALREQPQFAEVAEVRTATVMLDGTRATLGAVDPRGLGGLVKVPVTAGTMSGLRAGTVAVSSAPRDHVDTAVGGAVTVSLDGHEQSLTVVARGALPGGGTRLDALVTWDQFTALAGPGDDTSVLVKAAPGVSATASRDAVDRIAAAFPLVQVSSLADLSSRLGSEVSQQVGVFGGLIGVAILISLFGVANTMSMSVVERTRESATMRAVGLTRAQLRATLLIEALLMGLASALVGVAFGLVFGGLVVRTAFVTIGPTVVNPWWWIAALVGVACGCSVLAAVLPARRAARASIVEAMAEV